MTAIIIPMDKIRAGRRLLAAGSPTEVGLRIAAALKVAGLQQVDLIRQFGFQSSQVSQWIDGRNRPMIDNLLLMLPTLGVDANYILLGDFGAMPYSQRDALLSAYEEAKAEAVERHAARERRGKVAHNDA